MRCAAARYSCSGRLADDRPMSGLRVIDSGDSCLILTSQFRVRSIILMLLSIQMSNMSDLSLCYKGSYGSGSPYSAHHWLPSKRRQFSAGKYNRAWLIPYHLAAT